MKANLVIQPSQNVPAAGHLAVYNEYLIINIIFSTSAAFFRRPLQLRSLLPITIASLPTTQKHFDWTSD